MVIRWTTTPTDLGVLLVAATDCGLCAIRLGDGDQQLAARLQAEFPAATLERDGRGLGRIVEHVLTRIRGEEPDGDIPLDISGTAFQRRVWEELRRIPLGEVRTYGEVAAAIGAPRAVRAVGHACATNPVAIVVPCHRVVPKRGGVGNYGFGPERKRELLRREGASLTEEHDGPTP